jgi:hypothetical protein
LTRAVEQDLQQDFERTREHLIICRQSGLSNNEDDIEMIRNLFLSVSAAAALFILLSSDAHAVPDCWGVIALNAAQEKTARITCSDDRAPGSAASYKCSFTWKMKAKGSGQIFTLSGSFVSGRGDSKVVRYEESRLSDGSQIDDEADGMSMSCAAQ